MDKIFEIQSDTRGFDLVKIEDIIRYSRERYFDTSTDRWVVHLYCRWVVVGKHTDTLVMIPHEIDQNKAIIPITIHVTTRQQINYRVKSERFNK